MIEEVVAARSIPKARWKENAHTRRVPGDSDIVVRAKTYSVRYLQKPFKLSDLARTMKDAMLSTPKRGGTQIGRTTGAVHKMGGSLSSDSDRQTGFSSFIEQDESW